MSTPLEDSEGYQEDAVNSEWQGKTVPLYNVHAAVCACSRVYMQLCVHACVHAAVCACVRVTIIVCSVLLSQQISPGMHAQVQFPL